jgi:hypothetical protein
MKNRYRDEYSFEKVSDNVYTIVGNLKHIRYGCKEGQSELDLSDLGMVDPSGGPFFQVGMNLEGRKITKISVVDEKIYFEVE